MTRITPCKNATRCLLACLVLSALGCGSKIIAVDEDAARSHLTKALDTWKGGGQPSAMRQQEPAVFVSDDYWDKGRKLTSYKVNGAGTADTRGNLRVPVTLTLQAPQKPETIETAYIVTVSPAITIFREFQQ